MKTFKNTAAENNSTVTNIHFVKAEQAPEDFGKWVEVDEIEIDFAGSDYLWRQGGVEFYGKL